MPKDELLKAVLEYSSYLNTALVPLAVLSEEEHSLLNQKNWFSPMHIFCLFIISKVGKY